MFLFKQDGKLEPVSLFHGNVERAVSVYVNFKGFIATVIPEHNLARDAWKSGDVEAKSYTVIGYGLSACAYGLAYRAALAIAPAFRQLAQGINLCANGWVWTICDCYLHCLGYLPAHFPE